MKKQTLADLQRFNLKLMALCEAEKTTRKQAELAQAAHSGAMRDLLDLTKEWLAGLS